MTAIESVAIVNESSAKQGAYLVEQIQDELVLAPLLGWANISPPTQITPNAWIFGTHHMARGHGQRNTSAPCPRWRRSNDCFELISPCEMMITCTEKSVGVSCPDSKIIHASYIDHPSKDDAIRYAICKAAIAYLTAKSTTTKATP